MKDVVISDCIETCGIGIRSGEVLSSTLNGGGIYAENGVLIQGNKIENAPSWAIYVLMQPSRATAWWVMPLASG